MASTILEAQVTPGREGALRDQRAVIRIAL